MSDAAVTQATTPKPEPVMQEQPALLPADKKEAAGGSYIQTKLTVGSPDDPYEKEADSVADQVIRMPETSFVQRKCAECDKEEKEENEEKEGKHVQRKISGESSFVIRRLEQTDNEEEEAMIQPKLMNGHSFAQRKCAHCEEEEKEKQVQRKPLAHSISSFVQTKAEAGAPGVSDALSQSIQSSRGSGSPLDGTTSSFMQTRFGTDFNDVKIHTDSGAIQMNRELNAKAFTVGNDVYFNQGQYQPQSDSGKHLLAHELTHVVQQSGSFINRMIQRKPVEEPEKYPGVVNYKKARTDNLASWYERYKFYNLFKETETYPGSTPIAYANKVHELQVKVKDAYKSELAKEWTAPDPGILEPVIDADSTLIKVATLAGMYEIDPTKTFGLDAAMMERLNKYAASNDRNAPALVSEYFAGISQLESVNRNSSFHISFDDRGVYVNRIQQVLMKLNYDIGADAKVDATSKQKVPTGIFGKGTKEAVKSFQKDSGFEGKDVDGVVGQMTLRFLDKRMGAPLYKPQGSGSAYAFSVPITAEDLQKEKGAIKSELLKRALKTAFPITDAQADVLIASGWNWKIYKGVTQDNVNSGYMKVLVPISSYEGVVGKAEGGTGTGESLSQKLEGQAVDLLKAGRVYELNKQIDKKRLESAMMGMSMNTGEDRKSAPTSDELKENDETNAKIRALNKEIEGLVAERDAELRKLGITLDEYEKLKAGFVTNFEKFAVQTAYKMLAENEMQANIEEAHYKKMEEVQAIKTILADLGTKYSESETLWWQSVSKEEGYAAGYKDQSDYIAQNTELYDGPGGSTKGTTTYNTERFYNEKNVATMYKSLETNPSAHYADWQAKEKEVVTLLQESVKKFPILAYPKLELRRNAKTKAKMDDTALQTELQTIISNKDKTGVKDSIAATKDELRGDPGAVWKLPIVIMRAKYELGVLDGTVLDKVINEKQESYNTKSFWENVGWALLGIGLGLLALASGPVGWLALGASIAVGGYDAYRTYKEITFKKNLSNTAINPADALGTEDPTYFWFWVSLVCVGLDVLQAAKLVKSISKGVALAKDVESGLNATRKLLQEELDTVGKASERGKQILKEMSEIDEALTKVKTTEFIENQKILEPLKSNPMAVVVMSEALRDKHIVKAVTSLSKILDKEMFENALKYYSTFGRKSIDELPEMVRLIDSGQLTKHPELLKDLFSDTRLQRVLLDTQDPELLIKEYGAWKAALQEGESVSLLAFLERKGLKPGFAGETKLTEMFGEAFAKLPNSTKNRQILRTIEPNLLDAFNANKLPKDIQKAMEVMLNSEILEQTTRLSSAQQRMLSRIKIMGSVIESPSDFSKVMGLLDNPTSRKALWEGATQLAGKDAYMSKIYAILDGKALPADVFDDMIRIGPMTDDGTIALLLQEKSKDLRKMLALSPDAVAVLKKCASPCLPAFLNADDVLKVSGIMKGKSREDILKIREYLYSLRDNEEAFRKAMAELEADYGKVIKDLKPTVINKPAALKEIGEETLRRIVDLGLPISELNKIMANAAAIKTGGDHIILELIKVLELQKTVATPNFSKLITGLASTNPKEFKTASFFLDEAWRFTHASEVGGKQFKYTGLEKLDALLGKYSIAELEAFMAMRWENSFVSTVFDLGEIIPGIKTSEIVTLAKKAGTETKGDLIRLHEIIDSTLKTSGKTSFTYDEMVKAIEAANTLRSDVAKAFKDPSTGFDALVKLIWGDKAVVKPKTTGTGVDIEIAGQFGKSGSRILAQARDLGKMESIAANLLDVTGTKVDPAKWKVFREVIDNSDIASILKSKLVGEMWGLAQIKILEKEGYVMGKTLFKEVGVSSSSAGAIADVILVKGNEIIVVEFKTGGNVYSPGQKEIYQLIKDGKFKEVMLTGNEALAAKFADPAVKKSYRAIEESALIPAH